MLAASLDEFGKYPMNKGLDEFCEAAAAWLGRRFALPRPVDPATEVLILNGSREGLFLAGIAAERWAKGRPGRPAILMPNPFYGAYEAGAVAAHAEPVFLPATAATGFLPDLDSLTDELLARTVAFYLASPANPQGSVASADYFARLAALARKYGFIVFSDECYSEIYTKAPPPSMLEHSGRDFENVVVFQSLSKRSNLPGLRVGFVAGDRKFLARFLELRNVSSPQVPIPAQRVAIAAYGDEAHVEAEPGALRAEIRSRRPDPRQPLRLPAAGRRLSALARRLRAWRRRGGDAAALDRSGAARHSRQLSRARAGRRL